MKTKSKKNKRNTLAVRLSDYDYDAFMSTADKSYSQTLRKLIQLYNKDQRIRERLYE